MAITDLRHRPFSEFGFNSAMCQMPCFSCHVLGIANNCDFELVDSFTFEMKTL